MTEEPNDQNETATLEHEKLERIYKAEQAAHDAECVLDEAKRGAKEAKDAYEAAVAQMRAIIRSDATQMELDLDANSDAWRDVGIEELGAHGLSAGIIESLGNGGIDTIGSLATHFDNDLLIKIEGIGSAKVEAIKTSLESFYQSKTREEVEAA